MLEVLDRTGIRDDELVISSNLELRLDGYPRSNQSEPSDQASPSTDRVRARTVFRCAARQSIGTTVSPTTWQRSRSALANSRPKGDHFAHLARRVVSCLDTAGYSDGALTGDMGKDVRALRDALGN